MTSMPDPSAETLDAPASPMFTSGEDVTATQCDESILREAWEFVRSCAAEDYRGPMPQHVRRARALVARRTDG